MTFTLDENIPKPVVMISDDFGAAVFRDIVKKAVETEFPITIKLLHSTRKRDEIPFLDDFERWSEGDRFWYIPSLLDEAPTDWEGELGEITREMVERQMEDGSVFYVCGNPEFSERISSMLQEMGVDPNFVKKHTVV